jgi:hypothetical protein
MATPAAAPLDGPKFRNGVRVRRRRAPRLFTRRIRRFWSRRRIGIRQVSVTGSVQAGTWLRLTVQKTNGVTVAVSYTNQVVGVAPANVLSNLFGLINAAPELQGSDGVLAEDFTVPAIGSPWFNLLPRQPGLAAAGVRVALSSSGTLVGNARRASRR